MSKKNYILVFSKVFLTTTTLLLTLFIATSFATKEVYAGEACVTDSDCGGCRGTNYCDGPNVCSSGGCSVINYRTEYHCRGVGGCDNGTTSLLHVDACASPCNCASATCSPTGGWVCTDPSTKTCSWSSSGDPSQTNCETNCTVATPIPPPEPCNGTVCGGDQACCNGSFCYNPATEGYRCTPFESACQGTSNICGTGAGVPGALGTNCNSDLISYRNTAGKVTLAITKTDGSSCNAVWGGREDWVGDTFGGLAVWRQNGSSISKNDLLRPNYPDLGGGFPEFITKNLTGILPNDGNKISLSVENDSPDSTNTYLLNPACATNSEYGGPYGVTYHYPYVFNDTTDRSQDADNEAERRWDVMQACYRIVQYKPIECTIRASAASVNVGGNLTVYVDGGTRTPVKIDGGGFSPGYTARIFVERADFGEITPLPASLTYTNGQPDNRYYYSLPAASCTFDSATGQCHGSVDVPDLPAGSYKFHCDIPRVPYGNPILNNSFEPQNCTGNPWCDVNGGAAGNTCTDWLSCSDNDNLNVVVNSSPPGAAAGLVSSCSTADILALSWDPGVGAESYLLQISDGVAGIDNIDVVSPSIDACPGDPDWDACIETFDTSAEIQILDPTTFTAGTWRVYSVNSGGQSLPVTATLSSCIPDCNNLQGPDTIVQGEVGTFSANFSSTHGYLGAAIISGQAGSMVYNLKWNPQSTNCGNASTSCDNMPFAWNTTGVALGDYDILCRAWNDGKAECRGKANYIDAPPRYSCPSEALGVTYKTVTILPPQRTISGTVYDGLGQGTLTYCANSGSATAWNGGDAMSVAVSGLTPAPSPSGTTLVNGTNGTYSSNPFESNGTDLATVQMSGIPSGYSIICPAGAQYSGIPANVDTTGVDFYISQIKGPWWQTRSGLAYGTAITSSLPYGAGGIPDPLCVLNSATCVPFLITGALGDVDPYTSAGIPMASAINGTAAYDSQHKNAGGAYFDSAIHSDAALANETYAVLSRRFDLTTATSLSSPLTGVPSGATPQVDANVYKYTGDLDISPSPAWNIAGQKIVIFVDGSVTINGTGAGPFITVGTDSFFAIIATGDITFDQDIGATIAYPGVPTITPQIEGMYVADGMFTVEASSDPDAIDKMFIGAGSFVGWSSVSLPRDFETVADPTTGLLNSYVPTDTFIFRPDFILNTPELMKRSTFSWREINSITQD